MPFIQFTLPSENQHDIDPAWFDKQKQCSVEKNNPTLRNWLIEQVDALKAFHDGDLSADAAAAIMRHPISTSSVPDLGSYSDEAKGVGALWKIFVAALIEWQSTRTPALFALLDATADTPEKIHKGEATDEEGKPLEWRSFHGFSIYWPDYHQPGQICRQCSDEAELALARRLYMRIRDLEAQLKAKRVIGLGMRRIQYIILALEKNIDDSDRQIATNEATAYEQVKLDFHIPAISFLFRHDAREIYDRVVRDELRDWTPAQLLPEVAKTFETGAERWSFWKRRLDKLAQGKEGGDEVAVAARSALGFMVLCEVD